MRIVPPSRDRWKLLQTTVFLLYKLPMGASCLGNLVRVDADKLVFNGVFRRSRLPLIVTVTSPVNTKNILSHSELVWLVLTVQTKTISVCTILCQNDTNVYTSEYTCFEQDITSSVVCENDELKHVLAINSIGCSTT